MKKNTKIILYTILTAGIVIPTIIYLIMNAAGEDMEGKDILIIIPIFAIALLLVMIGLNGQKKINTIETNTLEAKLKMDEDSAWRMFRISLIIFVISGIITLVQIAAPGTFPDAIFALAICGLVSIMFVFGAPASLGNVKRIKNHELYPIVAKQKVEKGNICIYFGDEYLVDCIGTIRKVNYNDIAIIGLDKTYTPSLNQPSQQRRETICIVIVYKNSQEIRIAQTITRITTRVGISADVSSGADLTRHFELMEEIKKRAPGALVGYNKENLEKIKNIK